MTNKRAREILKSLNTCVPPYPPVSGEDIINAAGVALHFVPDDLETFKPYTRPETTQPLSITRFRDLE